MIQQLNKLYKTNDATLEELEYILNNLDEENVQQLLKLSLQTKEEHYTDTVFMRGLIEISNYCKQNCEYCGIRRENTDVDRYRLDKEGVLECCQTGYDLGYRTFVLQGGEDNYYTDAVLVDIISTIKVRFPECAITLSLGERSYDSYKALYEAGADRYLLRHETASQKLYEKLHPGMSFENRRRCHQYLKDIGFQVGAGCMVGLPGQTNHDLAMDLRYLKDLEPQMVGIGPFIPHKKTPLGEFMGGTVDQTLIMLALTRLLLPSVLLPSTTALGTLDNLGREKALKAGGNVVMPNLSPIEHREKYELYEDKICTGDEAAHCRKCIEGRINAAGFRVDMSRGDHVHWKRRK
jgi:biotin synthase